MQYVGDKELYKQTQKQYTEIAKNLESIIQKLKTIRS